MHFSTGNYCLEVISGQWCPCSRQGYLVTETSSGQLPWRFVPLDDCTQYTNTDFTGCWLQGILQYEYSLNYTGWWSWHLGINNTSRKLHNLHMVVLYFWLSKDCCYVTDVVLLWRHPPVDQSELFYKCMSRLEPDHRWLDILMIYFLY